jgi:tRNA modification GTPase
MSIQDPTSNIKHQQASPTYVVELTPPGRAAVAVILVAGPAAAQAIGRCFAPLSGQSAEHLTIGRIVVGRWGGAGGEELIACRRGDEQFEIHSHGGSAAAQLVIDRLVNEGCAPIAWKEWARTNSPAPIHAAARIALADAVTERTAAILLDQLNGALASAIRTAIADVAKSNWSGAADSIDTSLRWRELGLHLTKPWRVVVCGPPNVGKSSLINALAGYERAIVSPTPGTTRDIVTVTTAIDGWPIQLADTAGFRTTRDELESAGIALAAATVAEADLAVVMQDATSANENSLKRNSSDTSTMTEMPPKQLHVINKIDLLSKDERAQLTAHLNNPRTSSRPRVLASAITGKGIPELAAAISRELLPECPPGGAAVPFTTEHIANLVAAREAIENRDAEAAASFLQAMLTTDHG